MNVFEPHLLEASGTTPVVLFSPWYPRGGDHATHTLEVVHITGGTIKIEAFHKKAEDSGDGTQMGSGGTNDKIERTSAGRSSLEFNDSSVPTTFYPYMEIWRYRITFTPTSGTQSVLYRMLPVSWYDAMKP